MKLAKILCLAFLVFNTLNIRAIEAEAVVATELANIENIGDKPIIIGVHGVGDATDWIDYPDTDVDYDKRKMPNYDLISFKWKQGKITKGSRDKHIITGGKALANLILDIYEKRKSREKDPQIIIFAHSMGGNVTKIALNLLDKSYKKEKKPKDKSLGRRIKTFAKSILHVFKPQDDISTTEEDVYVDTRFETGKGNLSKLKNIFTKKYYVKADNEIRQRMQKMAEKNLSPRFPIVEEVYTLGTPNRLEGFPFNENMETIHTYYNLYSLGDKKQAAVGFRRIEIAKKNEPFKEFSIFDQISFKKFNIQVQIKEENGKLLNPNHNTLIRDSTIVPLLTKLTIESIDEALDTELDDFGKKATQEITKKLKGEKVDKEQIKSELNWKIRELRKKINTIIAIFPAFTDNYPKEIEYKFDITEHKESFAAKRLGPVQVKI